MFEIGDKVLVKEDQTIVYIYDRYLDSFNQYYYQAVFNKEELYRRWPAHLKRIIFWDNEFVKPKTKTLKNGHKIITSR